MSKHPYHERKVRAAEARADQLATALTAALAEAAREHVRAESEYETVDAIAALLTELGRPDEEEILDGVRWFVAECDRLRTLLRECEWNGACWYAADDPAVPSAPFCPVCHQQQSAGHTADCRLKAALA